MAFAEEDADLGGNISNKYKCNHFVVVWNSNITVFDYGIESR